MTLLPPILKLRKLQLSMKRTFGTAWETENSSEEEMTAGICLLLVPQELSVSDLHSLM